MASHKSQPTLSDLSEMLVSLWSDILETSVDPRSNLLALGASSLSAAAVATNLAKVYPDFEGIEIVALQAVFEVPTISQIAEVLDGFVAQQAPSGSDGI
jgi:hypothetical protein